MNITFEGLAEAYEWTGLDFYHDGGSNTMGQQATPTHVCPVVMLAHCNGMPLLRAEDGYGVRTVDAMDYLVGRYPKDALRGLMAGADYGTPADPSGDDSPEYLQGLNVGIALRRYFDPI